MSTATYDTPLRVVPDIQVTKERFARAAYLRELRGAAYTAFYKAMSLPRSIVRWGLGQLHRWAEATGGLGVLSWVSDYVRDAAGLIRTAGVVPSVLAVLSTPPVSAAAVRVAKFIGRGIGRVAKAAWTGVTSLLSRCGSTGSQIVQSLSHTGTQVSHAVKAVAKHPMMAPVVHALRATLALVRPVSQGLVASRLLAALVPILWLRAVIGFMFMPFLVDSTMVGKVWDWATAQPATPKNDDTEGTDDGDLLINTLGIPMPGSAVPCDKQTNVVEQSDVIGQADDSEADEDQHLNRASRRAQQREDAHPWRMQHR
jgi:hypothetical protein